MLLVSGLTFTLDCANPERLAGFWTQALGYLEALGGQRVSDRVVMGDYSWVVMADPEGNEFCIVRRPE